MPLDDNDRARAGNLGTDPGEGCEPVAAPTLRGKAEDTPPAPPELRTFADLYGPEQLEADRNRRLVSLATLPSWPGGPATGHGIGETLDVLLGGGICPGYMAALGAAHAAAGKTAFLAQLADGLALRTAALLSLEDRAEPLTPVVVLSEMGVPQLTWRSLARWTNRDSRIFRAGKSATQAVPGLTALEAEQAFEAAREALTGKLGLARRFILSLTPTSSGPDLVAELGRAVVAWRARLLEAHPGREIWPVLFVDPIQRWQDHSKPEVEALNELVEQLADLVGREGLVAFATSDTNKSSAIGERDGDARELATAAFRGSYKLFHLPDAALLLERGEDGRSATIHVAKNRWGPQLPDPKACARFHWNPTRASFAPFAPEEERALADAAAKALDVKETARTKRAKLWKCARCSHVLEATPENGRCPACGAGAGEIPFPS